MAIKFACTCGKKLQARDDLGGRRMKCPQCQRVLTIPHEMPAAARHEAANGPAAPAAPAPAHEVKQPAAGIKAPLPKPPASPHLPEAPPRSTRPAPAPAPARDADELTEVIEQAGARARRSPAEEHEPPLTAPLATAKSPSRSAPAAASVAPAQSFWSTTF